MTDVPEAPDEKEPKAGPYPVEKAGEQPGAKPRLENAAEEHDANDGGDF